MDAMLKQQLSFQRWMINHLVTPRFNERIMPSAKLSQSKRGLEASIPTRKPRARGRSSKNSLPVAVVKTLDELLWGSSTSVSSRLQASI